MKQYTLKIYFGDKSEPAFFGGDRQDDSSNTTPFQVALKNRETVIHMPLAYVRVKNCHSL
jgi:hypothetical protein